VYDQTIKELVLDKKNVETNIQVGFVNLRRVTAMRDLDPKNINHLVSIKGFLEYIYFIILKIIYFYFDKYNIVLKELLYDAATSTQTWREHIFNAAIANERSSWI
jgi:DNA replicative helicase MCM subunit Mcm2 (Cdc46/Mcm family)